MLTPLLDNQVSDLFELAYEQDWDALLAKIQHVGDPKILLKTQSRLALEDGWALYPTGEHASLLHVVCSSPTGGFQVIKALLDIGGPELAELTDAFGKTALHDVILRDDGVPCDASVDVVEHLVKASSRAVTMGDAAGLSPLDYLSQRIIMKEEIFRYTDDADDEANVKYLLEYARIMLIALCPVEIPTNEPMVHTCVYAASQCPVSIRERALTRFSEQLSTPDAKGNLPIHIAALACSFDEEGIDTMVEILNAYHDGILARNKDRKLPLDLAIETGRTWSSGISVLFEAFPAALESQDIPVEHYALLLSAIGLQASIDTLYKIIQAKPDLFM